MSKPLNNKPDADYPTFGEGKETVYIYYFPTYEKYAKLNELKYYPCKIGMTVNTVQQRLKEQQAAMPEAPVIPFVIKCFSATDLEFKLQTKIKLKADKEKRTWEAWQDHCIICAGEDWVISTPQEIFETAKKSGFLSEKYNTAVKNEKKRRKAKDARAKRKYKTYLEENEIIKNYCQKHGINTQMVDFNNILKLAKKELEDG